MYKVTTIFTLVLVSLQRGRSDLLKNISPRASDIIEPPLESECHRYSFNSLFHRINEQYFIAFRTCFHFSPYYHCKVVTRSKSTGNLYIKCPCENITESCPPGNLIFDNEEELGSFWECSLEREKLDYWQYLKKPPKGNKTHILLHNTFDQNNEISNGSTEGQYVIVRSVRRKSNYIERDLTLSRMLIFERRLDCNVEEIKGNYPRKDLVCKKDPLDIPFQTIYVVLKSLCIAFGSATLLMFILLPPLRTMKTTILLCPTFCYFIVDLMDLRFRLGGWEPNYTECIAEAYNMQYWDLAVSFWDNIISFDLALTFRNRGLKRRTSRKTFLLYFLYGCGGPLIITMVTVILSFWVTLPPGFVKPEVNLEHCTFHTQEARLMYQYYPSMVLSVINIPLLGYAVYNIIKRVCTSFILRNEDSGRHVGNTVKKESRTTLLLYFNLALLIGSLRSLQPIKNFGLLSDINDDVVFAFHCTTLARAICIFLLVVCKKRVFNLIKERLHLESLSVSSVFTCFRSKSYEVNNPKVSSPVPQATTPL